MLRIIKHMVAKYLFQRLKAGYLAANRSDDYYSSEEFRQYWTFLQGQIITRGKLRWNWRKIKLK